jgi:putative membrane protein
VAGIVHSAGEVYNITSEFTEPPHKRPLASTPNDEHGIDRDTFTLLVYDRENSMEGKKHLESTYAKILLLLIFSAGLAGHTMEMSKRLMVLMTPASLTIASVVVLYPILRSGNRRFLAWCAITLLVTYVFEYIGVTTGAFFGNYTYGSVLGFKLLDVPVIIGMNWMLIILGAISIAQLVTGNIVLTAILTGWLAVIFDYILEPVAIFLNYWRWEGDTPPFKNYCTWFMLAFFITLLYGTMKVSAQTELPRYYFCIQVFFFLILSLLLLR